MPDTFFPECIICGQGTLSFEGVDISGVCFAEECQKKKDKIVKNLTTKCSNCGVEFLNREHLEKEPLCSICR